MSNVLFLLVGKNSSDHMESDVKLSTYRTVLYTARLLKKHGHNTFIYREDIDDVDYKLLDNFKADIVCVQPKADKKLIEWAKSTGALIGMGIGTFIDIKATKEYMNKHDYLDFVVVGGEPYDTWIKIANNAQAREGFKNIKGLVYRDGVEIKENGGSYDFNIDDFDDADILLPYGSDVAVITTSLGCIGNCSFCNEKLFHKKWKGRDVGKVIEEIKQYIDKGQRHFQFADTELEAPDRGLKRLTNLCQGIIDLKQPIYYRAMFRPDFSRKATPEIMDLLVRSGLYQAFIGVESGSQKDLDLFNKRCTVQDAKNTIKFFESHGVYVEIGFIMFQPFSTIESLTQNVDLLNNLGKADFDNIYSNYRVNVYDRLLLKSKEAGLFHEKNKSLSFKDEKVYQIFSFIHSFFNTIRPTLDRYDKALEHQDWYHNLKKIYEEDMEKREVLETYLRRTDSIMQTMSTIICIWFKQLLRVSEEGFSNEKAISISLSLLNEELISEITNWIKCETNNINNILGIVVE